MEQKARAYSIKVTHPGAQHVGLSGRYTDEQKREDSKVQDALRKAHNIERSLHYMLKKGRVIFPSKEYAAQFIGIKDTLKNIK